MSTTQHQSKLVPTDNKFHKGNRDDQKHYWLTPPNSIKNLMMSLILTLIHVLFRCRKVSMALPANGVIPATLIHRSDLSCMKGKRRDQQRGYEKQSLNTKKAKPLFWFIRSINGFSCFLMFSEQKFATWAMLDGSLLRTAQPAKELDGTLLVSF